MLQIQTGVQSVAERRRAAESSEQRETRLIISKAMADRARFAAISR